MDPDETVLDIPIDSRDYDDYPDGDEYHSPWMRPAYEPMSLEEEEAFRAFMAF